MRFLATVMLAELVTVALATAQTKAEDKHLNYCEFKVSQLRCVIGDNSASGEHQAGYNGVFNLSAPGMDETAFVPLYAGLNLEHYFDAGPRPKASEVFFEPRRSPMEFSRVNETTAELYQATTPVYGVESWTRFEIKEPYYIDMRFRCVPHKAKLKGGCLGVFWASYLNAPLDKSVYFLAAGSPLDKPLWTQYCTFEHGRDSTVCQENDTASIPFKGGPGTLYNSIAPIRYSAPFFYGRFRDRVLVYIFDPDARVRFSHSPSGGGRNEAAGAFNPAWDFQLVIPKYKVGTEYGLKMRLVYKPWVDRADVLNEVRRYLENH